MKYCLFALIVLGAFFVFKNSLKADVKIEASEAWKYIKAGALVVDVRSTEEFLIGHLDGAVNIPHDKIAERVAELGADKNREIVLYCKSGRRAGIARDTLKGLGFSKVWNGGGYVDLKGLDGD